MFCYCILWKTIVTPFERVMDNDIPLGLNWKYCEYVEPVTVCTYIMFP